MGHHAGRIKLHSLKKQLGHNEFTLYGANADLVEWIRSSKFAQETLGMAKLEEADLFPALGARNEGDVVKHTKKVILKLWESYPSLGPYPFLEQLSRFEFDRFFYADYRDHVSHQLKVYLLGLYVDDCCPLLKGALNAAFAIPVGAEAEFRLRWLVTAVYHDIGYVLENPEGLQGNGKAWQVTREALNTTLAAPLSTMSAWKGVLSAEEEAQIRIKWQIYHPVVSTPVDIERYSNNGRQTDLLHFLAAEAIKAGLGADGSPVRAYYDFAVSHDPPGRQRFRDHGVVSALLLLQSWLHFRDYVARLESINDESLLNRGKPMLAQMHGRMSVCEDAIVAAAGAMSLHNVTPSLWKDLGAVQAGLTLGSFKLQLTGKDATPLSFLLGLVDTLQDWDRPTFRAPGPDEKRALADQDISISVDHGAVRIFLPADAEKYRDPATENDSRYGKAVRALKAYLHDETIDRLVQWNDSYTLRRAPKRAGTTTLINKDTAYHSPPPGWISPVRARPSPHKLIAFDLDGTLLRGEFSFSWELVWNRLGFGDDIPGKLKREYRLNGDTNSEAKRFKAYQVWCDKACAEFRKRNLTREQLREMASEVTLTRNCREALTRLREAGLTIAIVSGGINTLLEDVFPDFRRLVDFVFINELKFASSGSLDGVRATPFDFQGKRIALKRLQEVVGCTAAETVFVGDHFNDEHAMLLAGKAIAYPPNDKIAHDASTIQIKEDNLLAILPYVMKLEL